MRNLLFDLSRAVYELLEIGIQLKKETINIADVIKYIDEMNYTKKDEEKYKKKTLSFINNIKSLYEKKEEIKSKLATTDEQNNWQLEKKLNTIENKIEDTLLNLKLNKKILEEIVRKITRQMKFMDEGEARIVMQRLMELNEIENGLKVVKSRLIQANLRLGIGEKTDYTLEEVGEVFGLTRERIRQIEAKALRKLKHPSRQKRLESFLE